MIVAEATGVNKLLDNQLNCIISIILKEKIKLKIKAY